MSYEFLGNDDIKKQVMTHIDMRKRGLKVLNIIARNTEDWCKQLARHYKRQDTPKGIDQVDARNIWNLYSSWTHEHDIATRRKFGLLNEFEEMMLQLLSDPTLF